MGDENLQKDYIRKVEKISINPLQCSNNYFNKTQKHYVPGKRYSLSRYPLKDYLTVASNQIVFELDSKTYATNYEIAKKIINVLKEREIPYYIFSSGGKGIHIEVWFTKPNMDSKEFKDLFIEALSYGLSFKHIRFWLWNKILDEAHLEGKLRGVGKIIDSACMSFDDLNHKTRLLRIVGGRKIVTDKISSKEEVYYKTFILKDEFNKRIIKLKDFNKVSYPQDLTPYKLNDSEFSEFLQEFVTKAVNSKIYKHKKVDLSKNKGYLGLDSVQRVLEGLPTGQRSNGAQILAIAMTNDGLDIDEQQKIMQKYVDNCSQIGDPFKLEEAMGWVRWVTEQKEIFWNCELTKQINVHNQDLCNCCKQIYKEANKLLTQSTILNQIEEVLSLEIKGETKTKMLMFLLMLSKDFPSKTGLPGWNIPGDPMSQNIILSSDSSSGKTWITKKILDLFGEKNKDFFIVSRYTKSVLNYYTEINMDNKIIFVEELQGLDESTNQLRVWMSEGELNLETVEKVKDEEGNEVNQKVTRSTVGQPVFITNQAEGVVEDQLNNRSWVLSTDVSDKQTKEILNYQDDINKGYIKDEQEKKRQIQDALQQLQPYHFIVPYSNNNILKIPATDVRSRRDYTKFMTLIKCSAYLHQKQRMIVKKGDNEFIVCDLKDYDIAKKYSDSILGATFSGLTIQQIDIITNIKRSSWKEEFGVTDLMRLMGKSQPHWYGQLGQLCDLGFIIADKQGIGKSTLYSLNEDKALSLIDLPLNSELTKVFNDGIEGLKSNNFEVVKPISAINKEIKILDKKNKNINPKFIGCEEPISGQNRSIYRLIPKSKFIGSNTKTGDEPINKTEKTLKTAKKGSKNQRINKSPDLTIPNLQYIKGKFSVNEKGTLFIRLKNKDIMDFLTNNNQHLTDFETLKMNFKCEDIELENKLKELIKVGEIYEPKPGRYMIL